MNSTPEHAPERFLVWFDFGLARAIGLQIGAMHSDDAAVRVFDRREWRAR